MKQVLVHHGNELRLLRQPSAARVVEREGCGDNVGNFAAGVRGEPARRHPSGEGRPVASISIGTLRRSIAPMIERTRQSAPQTAPIRPAVLRAEDPAALLEAHYCNVWQVRRAELPLVNAALVVEAFGFRRLDGDWLGVVITPWFLDLLLLSGGGALWGDIPAGQRRYLNLPGGTLPFIAADDPEIGPYQHCPLVASIDQVPDMATARLVAADAMRTVCGAQPTVAKAPPAPAAEEPAEVSRRGFFRRLAGKRN